MAAHGSGALGEEETGVPGPTHGGEIATATVMPIPMSAMPKTSDMTGPPPKAHVQNPFSMGSGVQAGPKAPAQDLFGARVAMQTGATEPVTKRNRKGGEEEIPEYERNAKEQDDAGRKGVFQFTGEADKMSDGKYVRSLKAMSDKHWELQRSLENLVTIVQTLHSEKSEFQKKFESFMEKMKGLKPNDEKESEFFKEKGGSKGGDGENGKDKEEENWKDNENRLGPKPIPMRDLAKPKEWQGDPITFQAWYERIFSCLVSCGQK